MIDLTGSGRPHHITRRAVISAYSAFATARPGGQTHELVEAMQLRYGFTIVPASDTAIWRSRAVGKLEKDLAWYRISLQAVAPNGRSICWVAEADEPARNRYTVVAGIDGEQQKVVVDGVRSFGALGMSDDAAAIVVKANSVAWGRRPRLLVAAPGRENPIRDLTAFVALELPDLERISVSGDGTLTAIATRQRTVVLRISDGATLHDAAGAFPKLSPDGQRLAFVEGDRLYVRSLQEGIQKEFLPGIKVKAAGGWSPDGRFLLAGAWTHWLAWEKRRIILDTKTGQYCVIDRLGEGDFGDHSAWVSKKLLARSY